MERIFGIDLGTTHSLCALFQDGAPVLIKNASGNVLTPSIVGFLPGDERVVIGNAARELAITHPERCAATFKRWMGTDRKVELAGHKLGAPELSSLVLKALKHDAEAFIGGSATDTVITVPAYFNDHQRQATKLAGELAGWKVRRIVHEPTAAALAYGFHDRDAKKRLLVFDLGGGTFDVTLMEVFEGTLEIQATAGESFLGGEDFTDRIIGWALGTRGLVLETAEMRTPLLVARLRQECERAKRELATATSATIRLPSDKGEITPGAESLVLESERFEALCAPLAERLLSPVAKVLRDAGISSSAVDDVILVGGATRMPLVSRLIERHFTRKPLCTFNPDEVVALGACIQGALIADDRAVLDLVLTDVCPHTLGINISKRFGSEVRHGYFLPIIDRNTTIPVSREEVVYTLEANQRVVPLQVYQGDARRVESNLSLGELKVEDIPPGPAGQPIHVRFTYDLNGILEVEAYLPKTRQRFRTVIQHTLSGLAPDEIAAAAARLQRLKFYPRDELENEELVLYCERLMGELAPLERHGIEERLDQFESAMSSGDREFFAHARRDLLIALSSCGFEYPPGSGKAEH